MSWGQLSTTCSNATEVAQWAVPSFNRLQSATDNGVRDGWSNWLTVTPTLYRVVPPKRHLYGANERYKSRVQSTRFAPVAFRILGHHIAHADTEGIRWYLLTYLDTWYGSKQPNSGPPHCPCRHWGYKVILTYLLGHLVWFEAAKYWATTLPMQTLRA